MRSINFITVITLLLAAFAAQAAAPPPPCKPEESPISCIGFECATVGTTVMTKDRTDILACLVDKTDNSLKWVSTTSSAPTCTTVSSVGGAQTGTVKCPSGYSLTGGSCDMYRGGNGQEIDARFCMPNATNDGYFCNEGNGGSCIAHAVCCK